MKRILALFLACLMLLGVAMADDELKEIQSRVETYVESMENGADVATLEQCIELLKNVSGGSAKKAMELYCKVLLKIFNYEFDEAKQNMYALKLLKKNFDEEFINGSGGKTSLMTIEELDYYLQGREAEYKGDFETAMTAYEQCLGSADTFVRMQIIEEELYSMAIDWIAEGEYTKAHEILVNLAAREYADAKQFLRDWNMPISEPTPTQTTKANVTHDSTTPKPTATAKATATPKPAQINVTIQLELKRAAAKSVELSWQCSTLGVTYAVQRKGGGNDLWQTLATVTTKSYTDNSAQAGTKYTYRIVAQSASGTSNEVSVTTLQNVTPTPKNITPPPVTAKPKAWGSWSSWSTNPVNASSTRQVETKVETEYYSVTVYHYNRWKYYNTGYNMWYYSYAQYTGENYKAGTGEWQYKTTYEPLATNGESGGHTRYADWWWNQTTTTEQKSRQVTYYRYRDYK